MLDRRTTKPSYAYDIQTRDYFILSDWIIALLPCIIWGMVMNNVKALIGIGLSVGVACLLGGAYTLISKCRFDLLLIIEAMLVPMCISAKAPLYVFMLSGALVFLLYFVRIYHGKFVNTSPALICLIVICFIVFHTVTPIDLVLNGTKSMYIKVYHLIQGLHDGGIGSISFVMIFAGYLYLSIRKRINYLIPLVFMVSLILGICIFYESTDLVTQLDYISYVVFDGKIAFAAVFLLTMPSVLPTFGKSSLIMTVIMAAALAYLLVYIKNCDFVYFVMGAGSLISRPLTYLKHLIFRKI